MAEEQAVTYNLLAHGVEDGAAEVGLRMQADVSVASVASAHQAVKVI
jgi:hypothetical protein